MDILTTQDGPIRTLTLNRPERRNPITDLAMVDALVGALEEADADGSVRAVILTGAGKAFCSGGDLRQMQPGPDSFCLLYTSPSPRDATLSRMPSSA